MALLIDRSDDVRGIGELAWPLLFERLRAGHDAAVRPTWPGMLQAFDPRRGQGPQRQRGRGRGRQLDPPSVVADPLMSQLVAAVATPRCGLGAAAALLQLATQRVEGGVASHVCRHLGPAATWTDDNRDQFSPKWSTRIAADVRHNSSSRAVGRAACSAVDAVDETSRPPAR